jgi:hypothetical protein
MNTENKQNKSMPLVSNVPVVKSAALPTKPPPVQWKDFDQFVATADELVEFDRALGHDSRNPNEARHASGDLEDCLEWCKGLVAECNEAMGRFDPSANYPSPDSDDDGDCNLKKSVVSKRLGVLIGSFPNAVPHSPEVYMKMLVEEVAAFPGLDTIILESACREIARTCKFAPSLSEVLEVLKKHYERWGKRYLVIGGIEASCNRAIKARIKWEVDEEQRERARKVSAAQWSLKSAQGAVAKLEEEIEGTKKEWDDRRRFHLEYLLGKRKSTKEKLESLSAQHKEATERAAKCAAVLAELEAQKST